MAGYVSQILGEIKAKIPTLFQDVIDQCKAVVEHFETHLKKMNSEAQLKLNSITEESVMPPETLKRFKEDQQKSLEKFKDEIEKKLRKISEKALTRIRDLNKTSQDVVTSVVEFQNVVKDRLTKLIDENKLDPKNLALSIKAEVEPLHKQYAKVKRNVEKMNNTLPKKLASIYAELETDVKKLDEQSVKKIESIVEKYKRLTT